MNRRERDLIRMAESFGLRVVEIGKSRGCHYRMVVETAAGERVTTFMAATPRDYRGDKNQRATFRRIAAGATTTGHHHNKRGTP